MSETAKERCSERVAGEGTWGGSYAHQCSRAGVINRSWKLYCKQHDPVAQQEKCNARQAKWAAESKRIDAEARNSFEKSRREQAAHEAALNLANVVLQVRGASAEMVDLARKVLTQAGEKS